MKTVNDTFVTSGKVNLLEHQKLLSSPSRTEKMRRSRNLIRIFFISVILVSFITGVILLALIRKYNIDYRSKQTKEASQIFCSMTEHFPACLSTIFSPIVSTSRYKWTSPDDIFVLSLELAIEQLSNLTSLTKSLILNSTDHQSRSDSAALQQCTSLIHDSLDRLNSSLTTSAGMSIFSQPESQLQKESLAREKVDYMTPKVNESVSDLRTCYQLLVKVESVAVEEVSGRVYNVMVDAGMTFDFLQARYEIKYQLENMNLNSGSDVKYEYWRTILMSFPQYLILVLLLWSIYRMY